MPKNRRTYCTKLDADLLAEVRSLARQKAKNQNDLIEEAMQDLLEKYYGQDAQESLIPAPVV